METGAMLTTIEELASLAKTELDGMSTKRLLERFQPILDEFVALSEGLRLANPRYNQVFTHFLDRILSIYRLRVNLILVKPSNYATNQWGPVYWKFFHYASILLLRAFEERKVNDMLNFPTLVYNIDMILPCPMCQAHYQNIKRNDDIRDTVKHMSFGSVMSGLQGFHNIVTENVDRTPEYAEFADRPRFTLIDYARTYGCIELPSETVLKTSTYLRNSVDWQTKTHILLTTLYALATSQSYVSASKELKSKLYVQNDSAERRAIIDAISDAVIVRNIDTNVLRHNAELYDRIIHEFYITYPEVVRALAKSKLPEKSNKRDCEEENDEDMDTENSEEAAKEDAVDKKSQYEILGQQRSKRPQQQQRAQPTAESIIKHLDELLAMERGRK